MMHESGWLVTERKQENGLPCRCFFDDVNTEAGGQRERGLNQLGENSVERKGQREREECLEDRHEL